MRRIPPPLLALAVVVVIVAVTVIVVAVQGSGGRSTALRCSKALAAGPFGCLVYVSVSGDQAWLAKGTAHYSFEKDGDGVAVVETGGCAATTRRVTISTDRYVMGSGSGTGPLGCGAAAVAHDAWMDALFSGTAKVVEHDDATVTVTNGSRSAVFQEVIAQ